MQNWLLQNLSDVLNRELQREENRISVTVSDRVTDRQFESKYYNEKKYLATLKAENQWRSALLAIERLLLSKLSSQTLSSAKQGLIFSGPTTPIAHAELIANFQQGVFTPDVFNCNALMPCKNSAAIAAKELSHNERVIELPLIPKDPIAEEKFCLILTVDFASILVLGKDADGMAKFYFSFSPETITEIWATLRSRLVLTNYHRIAELDSLVGQFTPQLPDYRLVSNFSRQLLENLPDATVSAIPKTRQVETILTKSHSSDEELIPTSDRKAIGQMEMDLLQALTHEVRTPLTTIRTLTKLLLKRKQDFKPNVINRLQAIDRECTEQIERMELIFKAAEFESAPVRAQTVELVPFSLERVFQQSIPRWQQKAQRRNVDLEFSLPQELPQIVSDPAMLDRVLTGLIENCTRSLPTGGHIDVKVSTAGDRLKLQVLSQANTLDNFDNPLKSLGQLLTFQPKTGCLSLNLDVTKNIFQALGGKLTVRQRQEQGRELTIFLPLGNSRIV